jgi:hypothetical protein
MALVFKGALPIGIAFDHRHLGGQAQVIFSPVAARARNSMSKVYLYQFIDQAGTASPSAERALSASSDCISTKWFKPNRVSVTHTGVAAAAPTSKIM